MRTPVGASTGTSGLSPHSRSTSGSGSSTPTQPPTIARLPGGAWVKVLVRNLKGKAVLDFKGIPVEQVGQLVEAISGQLPPVREVRLVEQSALG
jgi:hypothetical protein